MSPCGLLGPQALWAGQGTHQLCWCQNKRTMGRRDGKAVVFSLESGCLICGPLPGFSITQLQRKQAMLNASKQQAIGKPKGKRVMVPPPPTAAQPKAGPAPGSSEVPTALYRWVFPSWLRDHR